MPGKVSVQEVEAKSIMNRSRIPTVDYAINPYTGCQHGCVYCYARFMKRYTGHINDEWGSFVDVKINGPTLLERQLGRRRESSRDRVVLSTVTDPYQPQEREYEITRRCLEILGRYDFPTSILTKSDLVMRDEDLLSQIPEAEVGATIITLDERVRRVFEAGATPSERRVNALRRFSQAGIQTYAFLGPIIPILSTPSLDDLIRMLGDIGVSHVLIDRLNIKYGNKPLVEKALTTHFPTQAQEVLYALQPSSIYYMDLKDMIEDLCMTYGVKPDIIF
ncbi:MAG: radical SAM protein [Candidatus Thorarchaeota archaeon]|nr:MAG: radical SAM protein [Candidatus Thorarchaeota archaeon]